MKPKQNFLDYMQKSTFGKTNTAHNPERTILTEKPMGMFFFAPYRRDGAGWSMMRMNLELQKGRFGSNLAYVLEGPSQRPESNSKSGAICGN